MRCLWRTKGKRIRRQRERQRLRGLRARERARARACVCTCVCVCACSGGSRRMHGSACLVRIAQPLVGSVRHLLERRLQAVPTSRNSSGRAGRALPTEPLPAAAERYSVWRWPAVRCRRSAVRCPVSCASCAPTRQRAPERAAGPRSAAGGAHARVAERLRKRRVLSPLPVALGREVRRANRQRVRSVGLCRRERRCGRERRRQLRALRLVALGGLRMLLRAALGGGPPAEGRESGRR
jgi:hypothetical protein